MTTKNELTEQRRGKGGSFVRIIGDERLNPSAVFVVKDLMKRKSWNQPEHIGIGPVGRGWAIGVKLQNVEVVTVDGRPVSEQER